MVLADSQWSSNRQKTIADIQPGGSGYTPQFVGVQHNVGAIAGGGVTVERRWGQSRSGDNAYLGKNITSDPQPFSGDVNMAMHVKTGKLLKKMQPYLIAQALPPYLNLRVRQGENIKVDYIGSYERMKIYVDVVITNQAPSDVLKRGETPDTAGDLWLMETLSIDAAYFLDIYKLAHAQNSGAAGNYAINKVIKSGLNMFACTDLSTNSKAGFSQDFGVTWTFRDINTLGTAGYHALDILEYQNLLLVASDQVGITYAETQDVIDGVATPWIVATLNGVAWATTFPNGVIELGGNKAICFGDGGFIAEASSGQSFTEPGASTVVTSDDLSVGVVATDDTAFLGGANTTNMTVIKYKNGSYSAVVVVATNTDTITALAVPPGRPNWLFVGTDAGEIYVCKDTSKATPVFTLLDVPDTGTGSIDDIQFDVTGALMYYIHTISGASTVRRDLSGGAGGANVEAIASPVAVVMNSLALADYDVAIVVGEVVSSQGYVGIVQP